jgi:hypothetical protein
MRLLPRSRRGTWLLAGALWCAACAVWWWALPVAPRAVLDLANDVQFLSFDMNPAYAIVARYMVAPSISGGNSVQKLNLVDVSSGRVISDLSDDPTFSKRTSVYRGPRTAPAFTDEPESEISPDGRYILYSRIESSGITALLPTWLHNWLDAVPDTIRGEIFTTGTGEHVGDVFAPRKGSTQFSMVVPERIGNLTRAGPGTAALLHCEIPGCRVGGLFGASRRTNL